MRQEDAVTYNGGAQGGTSRMGQGEPRERVVRPHGPRRAVVLRHFRRQAPQNTCGFIYKRAANTFQGNAYEADDSRPEDCEMDGKKFATMLMTNVFPAIRKNISGAKLVTVQMDNAGGHGMATLQQGDRQRSPGTQGGRPYHLTRGSAGAIARHERVRPWSVQERRFTHPEVPAIPTRRLCKDGQPGSTQATIRSSGCTKPR